jgi:hypothetical protein
MFKKIKLEGRARRGEYTTPHGTVQTPGFMNVGTQGAIKGGLSAKDLKEIGCQVELSNTYHLHLRPGDETVRALGGLHRFMNWDKPILTDSGGFQVFSLAHRRKIVEQGVSFNSYLDGRRIFIGPEESMRIQSNLASTIAMAFDECIANPSPRKYVERSIERTTRWLIRCRDWGKQLLFLLCLFLFPLSLYCIYLIAETGIIHAMVLYSFITVYVFALVAAEQLQGKAAPLLRQLLAMILALVAAGNIFYANAFYLKLHLRYENSYALYTGVAAQVRQTPGFDESTKLALLGRAESGVYEIPELKELGLIGAADDLTNAYTREYFLRRYVGFDVPFADEAEQYALSQDPRVREMPVYPAYGSVQMIDDYLVIRLGD